MATQYTVAENLECANSAGKNPSADKNFVILATDDITGAQVSVTDIQAKAALVTALASSYDGMWLQNYGVESTGNESVWRGNAEYGLSQRAIVSDVGFDEFSFETSGGTRHITNSLATVSNTNAGGDPAPDFKGAIGVTATDVQGVDVTIPVFNFTRRLVKSNSSVTASYIADVYALTGTVNDSSWGAYAAGEVLFLGASGVERGDDSGWDLTFKFSVIPNETNIVVGDITVPSKQGWEYMWVRYADQEDTLAKVIVKRPLSVHVEQVYRYEDFGLLEL